MNYYIVIPAHNEEAFLAKTLNSIEQQTLLPKRVVIVNDNSTDNTEKIIDDFVGKNTFFNKLNCTSSNEHLPGSKVVNAFNKGFEVLDNQYDFIVKLDADVILPIDYFKKITSVFKGDPKIGIAGGFVYEKTLRGIWELNHPMNKKHVRGAFKAYTKACFKAIGRLKNKMGWDTVDELLAQYHGFEIETINGLKVKHLRPTGKAYNSKAKFLQGKAMHMMGYGFFLTLIASLKMSLKLGKPIALYHNMKGYLNARYERTPLMVSEDEAKYIRKLRWKGIKNKGRTKKRILSKFFH